MTRRDALNDLANLLREPTEDSYIVVGRMLRDAYGPIEWRERITCDLSVRVMLAALAEELQALANPTVAQAEWRHHGQCPIVGRRSEI